MKDEEMKQFDKLTLKTKDVDLVVMIESDVCWVLLPGLPVNLHRNRLRQDNPDLPGLAHPVGLTQADLHLGDVEAGEDTEDLQTVDNKPITGEDCSHLQLLVRDAGREVEVAVSGAEGPGSDSRPPGGNIQHHHGLNLGQFDLLAVHEELEILVHSLLDGDSVLVSRQQL